MFVWYRESWNVGVFSALSTNFTWIRIFQTFPRILRTGSCNINQYLELGVIYTFWTLLFPFRVIALFHFNAVENPTVVGGLVLYSKKRTWPTLEKGFFLGDFVRHVRQDMFTTDPLALEAIILKLTAWGFAIPFNPRPPNTRKWKMDGLEDDSFPFREKRPNLLLFVFKGGNGNSNNLSGLNA